MNAPRLWKFVGATAVAAGMIAFLSPVVQNRLAPLYPADKRRPLGAMELSMIDGSSWSLADHRGNVVLVNFWATWCPPCRRETPDLIRLHERYAPRGFQVVGIAMDEDEGDIPPFLTQYRVTYPILLPNEQFALAGQVSALPTSLLVDAEGRVAAVYRGAVSDSGLAPRIESLLAEAKR